MANRFTIEAVFKATDGFSRPIAKMTSSLSKMTSAATGGLSKLNSGLDKTIAGLGRAAAAMGGLAAVGAAGLGLAAKPGADFEQAMAAVGAVSLMTKDKVAVLAQEARRLGTITKFSATEVAKGMEEMGRAGYSNAEIMESIGAVIAGATAEGAEFSQTAQVVSAVMKGMGLQAKDTARIVDVLALASAATMSSISSLGESMKNVAPVARQFNIPLEQAVASVAMLQDVGLDASEAGTSMATMLTKLAKPTDEIAAKMKTMGVTFQDAHGNMLPLDQVIANFAKASDKAGGNMQQVAFFAELLGMRGQKAGLNLKDLAGKLTDLNGKLINAKGTAAEMARLRMDNFIDQFKVLQHNVEDVGISIWDLGGPKLNKLVGSTKEWVQANKSVIVSKVDDFLLRLNAYLPLAYLWTKRIGVGVGVFLLFAASVKVAMMATWAFQAALAVASVGMTVFSTAMRIGAAITNRSNIALVASTAFTWLKIAAQAAYNAVIFVGAVAQGLFFLATGRSTAGTVVGTAVTWLAVAARTAWAAITGVASAVMAIFTAESLAGAAATGALTVAAWLVTAAVTAFNLILSISPLFLIGAVIIGVIAYLIKLAGGWDYVGAAIKKFGATAMSYISPVIDKVKSLFGWIQKAGSAVSGFMELGTSTPPGTNSSEPPALMSTPEGPAPQMTPQGMASNQELLSQLMAGEFGAGEISVKAEPGTKATVTKQPKGAGRISLDPSGGI